MRCSIVMFLCLRSVCAFAVQENVPGGDIMRYSGYSWFDNLLSVGRIFRLVKFEDVHLDSFQKLVCP